MDSKLIRSLPKVISVAVSLTDQAPDCKKNEI